MNKTLQVLLLGIYLNLSIVIKELNKFRRIISNKQKWIKMSL